MATAEEADPNAASSASASMSRKDKRKVAKKEKRKQKRKEVAEIERQEEEAHLNDPEEQRRIQLEMEMEKERSEKERREFEERERIFLEELERKKAEEEEERTRALEEEERQKELQADHNVDSNESDEWEYVDEGPPEIIWQGNEIIVKKNRVKVKKSAHQEIATENPNRPTSNPLPPQFEAFTDYKNASALTAQQILENVAQQTPNFGTEQDKAHCPFHLKTGVCRFGSRCSRVHFYPDKSCTLLMKNMYNGPGLAWEQDEGLEYTDEEVEHTYEEFYEDVHTEFLKFGEIINFKVCRNGSYHLRGNVYVHYKSLDSALLAYQSINGRYFAGKQVTCEFVSVTRWRVAICGDYMKSRLKTCSRGTACNFIHSFRNPCGDYEWADWDKPPPRFWVERMVALFGYSDEYMYDRHGEEETVGTHRNSSKRLEGDRERHHPLRSRSKEFDNSKRRSREHYEEDESRSIKNDQQTHISENKRRTWDLVHKPDEVKYSKKRDYHHKPDEVKYSKKRDYHDDECDSLPRHDNDEFSEKNSRQQETSSGSMDDFASHKRRKSVSNDSNRGRRRRSNGSDSESDLSDGITAEINHSYKRSLRLVIEDDSRKSYNHYDKKYPQNDSDHVKSNYMVETAGSSRRKKKLHNTKTTSEVEFSDEHWKSSDRRYEHGKSTTREEYYERSKSYDSSDYSCDSSAVEFDKQLQHCKSGSDDCRESLEGIETSSDRWVPGNIHTRKHDKHRRRSDHSYKTRENKDRGSLDWNAESSDARYKESTRSRGRSKSKEGEDPERKLKECGEHGRSRNRKSHRSDKKQENDKDGSHDLSSESYDECCKESRSKSSSKSREGRSRASRFSSERKRKSS